LIENGIVQAVSALNSLAKMRGKRGKSGRKLIDGLKAGRSFYARARIVNDASSSPRSCMQLQIASDDYAQRIERKNSKPVII